MQKTWDVNNIIEEISAIGRTSDGGCHRLCYTPDWLKAQNRMKEIMEDMGFAARFDSTGNLFGHIEGRNKARTVMTGSHIDTVKNGGKYDGLYGVAASLCAVRNLADEYGMPEQSVEVVSFCDEEGSRFPVSYWGSRNLCGLIDGSKFVGTADEDGIKLSDAMKSAGFSLGDNLGKARGGISAYVEIHIEQGQTLEHTGNQIGIVDAICGQKKYRIRIDGAVNHAGTTPMTRRSDALVTAAEIIVRIREKALAYGAPLVATVGVIDVLPKAGNVIPGQCEFSLDMRSGDAGSLGAFEREILEDAAEIAKANKTSMEAEKLFDGPPTPMNAELHSYVEEACSKHGAKFTHMLSGAGHDAEVMAHITRPIMIFVPSKDGVSHSPKEYTSPEQLELGLKILTETLHGIAYKPD